MCVAFFIEFASTICMNSVLDLLKQQLITQSSPGPILVLNLLTHFAGEGELSRRPSEEGYSEITKFRKEVIM